MSDVKIKAQLGNKFSPRNVKELCLLLCFTYNCPICVCNAVIAKLQTITTILRIAKHAKTLNGPFLHFVDF